MRFRGRLQTYERQAPMQPVATQPVISPSTPPDEQGFLQIQTSTAQGALPIANASVIISIENTILYNISTDSTGKSIVMSILAPSSELSQQPGSARPYSLCDATVYSPGYYTNVYRNIQIFPNTTSLQNVFLIPLPENQRHERLSRVYDADPHSLYEEGAE